MNETLASFRELSGIGPATEARLHDAGVYTWTALASVLGVLARAQERGGVTVRELSDLAAARARGAGADGVHLPADAERTESFIVRITIGADADPVRCTVVDVRDQIEQAWAGWPPAAIIDWIAERGDLARRGKRAGTGTRKAQARKARVKEAVTPAAGRGGEPVDATPAPVAPPAEQDHRVVLDAGTIIGGRPRNVDLALTTAGLPAGLLTYQADLAARELGQVGDPAAWTPLASQAGTASPGQRLPLHFGEVDLARGVQRLRLEMRLHTESPSTPVLALD
jgi:hypothetical protein